MSAAHILPPDEAIGLITVQEFEEMDLPDSCRWELIDGEVVSVTFRIWTTSIFRTGSGKC